MGSLAWTTTVNWRGAVLRSLSLSSGFAVSAFPEQTVSGWAMLLKRFLLSLNLSSPSHPPLSTSKAQGKMDMSYPVTVKGPMKLTGTLGEGYTWTDYWWSLEESFGRHHFQIILIKERLQSNHKWNMRSSPKESWTIHLEYVRFATGTTSQ